MNQVVHEIASSSSGYFLVGAQDSDIQPLKIYNCAYLFGPGWDSYQYYRKTHLVLLGEYFPFADMIPGFRDWIHVGIDMTPGPSPKAFEMKNPPLTFAPFICFEDSLPDVADKAVRLHPDFFVTITNDGWYTGWCAAWGVRQHLDNAVFRCIEHALDSLWRRERGHVASNGGEVERRRFHLRASQQHPRVGRRGPYGAHHQIVRAQAPMLRTADLIEQLDPTLPPGHVRRQLKSLEDDFVDLIHQQQLGQGELLLRRERADRVVSDGEQDAPRHRLLVVLDLALEVELVLVLERSGGPLRHAFVGGKTTLR